MSASPAGAATPTELTAADVNAWLDGYLPYALKTGDIAGAVVVVVKDGAVLTERGFGFADVEKRAPVDPKLTLFRPGSVSKLVTWTAVMQQVEQVYGTPRFLVTYFVGTVLGFYVSAVVNPLVPSVGSSAGIMGLIGAMIAFGVARVPNSQ